MRGVQSCLRRPAADNELGAMVSLAYNIGAENFRTSTLLRLFNAGDKERRRSSSTAGTSRPASVLRGLIARRADERAVFEADPG